MRSLAKASSLLALTALAFESAPAFASPTETSAPMARDHRDDAQPVATTTRYRRRPGPSIMMPLRIDIGAQGANTSHGYLPGVELRAGIHWASLSPTPTNFDVGLGLFGAALVGPTDDTMPKANNDVLYGGAYLEVGETLSHGDYWRTWASGRAEYLASNAFDHEQTGFGVAGRLSAELYTSGVGIEPRGVFLGTYAIGVYAEVAARDLGPDVSAMQVSGGLTFRTPLVFAP
ncbi:MAG TPA: hypothetical protein VL463_10850 [Kofleriaceae bacterium]|nr:hypothetical protein [Kofleriaceae bacterium]